LPIWNPMSSTLSESFPRWPNSCRASANVVMEPTETPIPTAPTPFKRMNVELRRILWQWAHPASAASSGLLEIQSPPLFFAGAWCRQGWRLCSVLNQP
jgi:predicted NAD/FAD-dependent oxidoreductase